MFPFLLWWFTSSLFADLGDLASILKRVLRGFVKKCERTFFTIILTSIKGNKFKFERLFKIYLQSFVKPPFFPDMKKPPRAECPV